MILLLQLIGGDGELYDHIETRMLYEVLYNMPPLYHLDKEEWEKHKDTIVDHSKVWSDFSKKVINKEMTKFEKLSDNVQMIKYGEDISVICNFSENSYNYNGNTINGKSLLIIEGNSMTEYTPKA